MRHIKKAIALVLSTALLIPGGSYALDSYAIGDQTYLSVRSYAESVGYSVSWEPETRNIVFKKNESVVKLALDSPLARKDDSYLLMDDALKIVDGKAYGSLKDLKALMPDKTVTPGNRSLEALVSLALANDKTIRTQKNSLDKAKESIENLEQSVSFLPIGPGQGASDAVYYGTWKGLLSAQSSEATLVRQVEDTKERLESSVTAAYYSLYYSLKKQDQLESAMNFAAQQLKEAEMKQALGLISSTELDTVRRSFKSASLTYEAQKQQVSSDYATLNELCGLSLVERYPVLDLVRLADISGFEFDSAWGQMESKSLMVFSLSEAEKLAKIGLDYYVYNSSGDTYLAKDKDLSNAKLALDNGKTALRKALFTTYQTYLQLEIQNDMISSGLEEAAVNVEQLTLKHKLGLATKLQLEAVIQKLNELMVTAEKNRMDRYQLAELLSKPWLIGGVTN